MLPFIAEHDLLLRLALTVLFVAGAGGALRRALRGQRFDYAAKHRGGRRSTIRDHRPRHAQREHARQIAAVSGPAVDDEPTVELGHRLIGAAA